MKKFYWILTIPLLLLAKGEAAVVVTYRGDAPNIFTLAPYPSDGSLDINDDGIMDFRFRSDAHFVAVIYDYGNNRFIAELATGLDQGNYPSAVAGGSIIGPDTTTLPGDWHHHTDNVSTPALSTGSALYILQYVSSYIAIEFEASDGIHYGWISYTGFSTPKLFPVYDAEGNITGYHEDIETPGGFIDAWAWETIPGKPIVAGAVPEPGSLLLSLSAGTLSLLRRRRSC